MTSGRRAAIPWWEQHAMMVLRAPARRELWRPEHRRELAGADDCVDEPPDLHGLSCLRQAQLLDYRTYLPGAILTKVDIAAMANGLEVRTPFVDRRVVEFAATIPEELLVDVGEGGTPEGKRPLKDLLRRWFPDSFVRRPKQGFIPPVSAWFARGGELRATVEHALLRKDSRIGDLFEPAAVTELVSRLDRTGTAEPLWLLFFLESWLQARTAAAH
jgi:asparagine synthase (glutamine-hydrolysing)